MGFEKRLSKELDEIEKEKHETPKRGSLGVEPPAKKNDFITVYTLTPKDFHENSYHTQTVVESQRISSENSI